MFHCILFGVACEFPAAIQQLPLEPFLTSLAYAADVLHLQANMPA